MIIVSLLMIQINIVDDVDCFLLHNEENYYYFIDKSNWWHKYQYSNMITSEHIRYVSVCEKLGCILCFRLLISVDWELMSTYFSLYQQSCCCFHDNHVQLNMYVYCMNKLSLSNTADMNIMRFTSSQGCNIMSPINAW